MTPWWGACPQALGLPECSLTLWGPHPPTLSPSSSSSGCLGASCPDGVCVEPALGPRDPQVVSLPPYSSAPPTLGGHTPEPRAQRGWQTPPSSALLTAVGTQSRAASHVKMMLQVLPSGRVSRFSIWAPKPPCSPELCSLPLTPCVDPQLEPHSPHPHCPPSRARSCLF